MPKIGFNPDAVNIRSEHRSDVRDPNSGCTFEPVMVHKPGIEAIIEGIRLAGVKGFVPIGTDDPTEHVDP